MTRFRSGLQVTVAVMALAASGLTAAQGITGRVAAEARERAQQQSQPRRESRPAQASPAPQAARPSRAPESQPSRPSRAPAAQPSRPARAAPAPQATRPTPRNESRSESRGVTGTAAREALRDGRGSSRTPSAAQAERRERGAASAGAQPSSPAPRGNAASGDRGVVGGLIQREYQNRDPRPDRDRNGRDWDRDHNADRDRDDRRDAWRARDRDERRRTVHVIHHLPAGYRDYAWNGSRYYYHGGHWYRPQGSTYVSVRVPYGFFISTLPGSYTSVWVGGTRYFYSDHHYYTWEPARRGYVVVRSPYGDDEEYDEPLDQDLYIYPAAGQSEQQQADDRYDCHRWAVDETGYDPIDDEYDAQLRENYLRAMTACLTGRGYTVR